MINPIHEDPVIAEIHAIREKILEDRGNDPRRYRDELRKRQDASGHQVVLAPQRVRDTAPSE